MANIIRRNQSQGETGMESWDPLRTMREWMRWDPFRELSALVGRGARGEFEPSFDLRETRDSYVIEADVPGVEHDDLDITLTGNRLQISGRRQAETEAKDETYYCYERLHGSFTRSFTLPEGIDPEHVRSDLRNGVLTIVIPKKPESQPKRISVGPSKPRS